MTSFAYISIYIGYTNLKGQCYENGNVPTSTTLGPHICGSYINMGFKDFL